MVKLFHLQKTKNLLLESIHLTYKQKGRPESDKAYNFPQNSQLITANPPGLTQDFHRYSPSIFFNIIIPLIPQNTTVTKSAYAMSRTGSSVYVAVAELYISSIYNMGYLAAILENKK